MQDEKIGQELLTTLQNLALGHKNTDIERFKNALRHWGNIFKPVDPVRLRAVDYLPAAAADANSPYRELLELFDRHKDQLLWEQSYKKEDDLVPDSMLANYGFTEVIGSRGPFVSQRIRCGVGIFGAGVDYPRHWHDAEEIYLPLSGSARFNIDGSIADRGPGEVVFVPSNTPHGFTVSQDRAMVLFYLWQAGELRQTSTFG